MSITGDRECFSVLKRELKKPDHLLNQGRVRALSVRQVCQDIGLEFLKNPSVTRLKSIHKIQMTVS